MRPGSWLKSFGEQVEPFGPYTCACGSEGIQVNQGRWGIPACACTHAHMRTHMNWCTSTFKKNCFEKCSTALASPALPLWLCCLQSTRGWCVLLVRCFLLHHPLLHHSSHTPTSHTQVSRPLRSADPPGQQTPQVSSNSAHAHSPGCAECLPFATHSLHCGRLPLRHDRRSTMQAALSSLTHCLHGHSQPTWSPGSAVTLRCATAMQLLGAAHPNPYILRNPQLFSCTSHAPPRTQNISSHAALESCTSHAPPCTQNISSTVTHPLPAAQAMHRHAPRTSAAPSRCFRCPP